MAILHFICGRAAEVALSQPTALGATTLLVPNADMLFIPGQPLLIADADLAHPEWLGPAHSITTVGLTSRMPLRRGRATGARLWQPLAWHALAARSIEQRNTSLTLGSHVERTLGGTVYSVQVATPTQAFDLHLEGLTPTSAATLLAFLETATQGGLLPFTLFGPSGELRSAWLRTSDPVRSLPPAADGLHTLIVPLRDVQSGVEA